MRIYTNTIVICTVIVTPTEKKNDTKTLLLVYFTTNLSNVYL